LLIEGFDSPPVLMTSYNPTYYQQLLEEYGFKKDADFFAYYCDDFDIARARVDKVASFAMKRYHFRIDRIDLKQVDREAKDIIKVLELIVANSQEEESGFEYSSPPSYEEISLEVKKLLPFIDRDLIYIARYGDDPIGFVLALPDYNQVLKKVNGKLLPFGFIKYLWYKNKIDGIRGFAQYVIPRFRNKAVNAAIFQKILLAAEKKKYRYIEGSSINENNLKSRRVFENAGFKPYRIYRVYQKIF
jgi:GNAT superfamily N-acetyltransferase